MDCSVFCTAESYTIKPLFNALKSRYKTTIYRDLIHIEVPHADGHNDAFFFSHGTFVCWDIPKEQLKELLSQVKDFEQRPLDEQESDIFNYHYGNGFKIKEDVLTLPDTHILTKLSISHGLAQSAKLATFETGIQKIFNKTKNYPEHLGKYGNIPLSKKQIRQKMGQIFIERNSINLHTNVLDVPEFFWETPEYEPLYKSAANYLDIETRVEVLNQRLDVVHELFNMLGSELNHQHSCRLEWAIILLIVVEVVLTLFRDVFHII